MAIEYILGDGRDFKRALAQQIYELVSFSARDANQKQPTYVPATLEELMDYYKPEKINDWLKPDIASVFAYDGDVLVGTGFLSYKDYDGLPRGATAYLSGMHIHPNSRRQGIGDEIWQRIVEAARRNGIKIIRGESTAFPATLEFYRNHGARVIEGEGVEHILPSGTIKFPVIEFALT